MPCTFCDYSKLGRTADGVRVCLDCGKPNPTKKEMAARAAAKPSAPTDAAALAFDALIAARRAGVKGVRLARVETAVALLNLSPADAARLAKSARARARRNANS